MFYPATAFGVVVEQKLRVKPLSQKPMKLEPSV
jgi:hypothetical protein